MDTILWMPYLIDGHNLIPKLGLRLDSPDDELELVEVLQEYLRLNRRQAEVFFDGAPAGLAKTRRLGRVTAHFVRAGMSADAAIKARLKKLGRSARGWTLVSSDLEVQQAGRSCRAEVMASEKFAGLLKKARRPDMRSKGDRQLSSSELDEWLKLFNKHN